MARADVFELEGNLEASAPSQGAAEGESERAAEQQIAALLGTPRNAVGIQRRIIDERVGKTVGKRYVDRGERMRRELARGPRGGRDQSMAAIARSTRREPRAGRARAREGSGARDDRPMPVGIDGFAHPGKCAHVTVLAARRRAPDRALR